MLNGIMFTDKSGTVRSGMCIKKVNGMVFDFFTDYTESVVFLSKISLFKYT